MDDILVSPRISERHPELSEKDVLGAWRNAIAALPRTWKDAEELVAIGTDANGRLVEMVAARMENGGWLIYHALTPPTKKMLAELGITRR